MNRGIFQTQLNTAWRLLKDLDVVADRAWPHYPENAASLFRGLSYLKMWEICFQDEMAEEYDEFKFKRDYENYLANPDIKENVTPLRYDYYPEHYVEGRHPASHFHFGNKNNVRVGTKKVLMPLSFVLFVIRQCYPEAWQKLSGMSDAEILCRNVRDSLEDVDKEFWNKLDQWELILA